jgi:uncharacterized BrkB/YihY/UPF0761 family membrane protein
MTKNSVSGMKFILLIVFVVIAYIFQMMLLSYIEVNKATLHPVILNFLPFAVPVIGIIIILWAILKV